jgi:hypothetical protein
LAWCRFGNVGVPVPELDDQCQNWNGAKMGSNTYKHQMTTYVNEVLKPNQTGKAHKKVTLSQTLLSIGHHDPRSKSVSILTFLSLRSIDWSQFFVHVQFFLQ